MRGLDCQIELDEIWGYIGKKVLNLREDDYPTFVTFGPTQRLMRRQSWSPLTMARATGDQGDVEQIRISVITFMAEGVRIERHHLCEPFGCKPHYAGHNTGRLPLINR
jgi:hypothetical protein